MKPEILAPAGDIDSLKAAFAANAGAVYFGLPSFNARQRAQNIKPEILASIVAEAKLREIQLYLTLNTLVTEEEIPELLETIDIAMISGIKVFIIQDFGIFYILKKFYPEAEIHISTQATTHTKGQISFLSHLKAERVNLSRELSIEEIKDFTEFAHKKNIEVEVFVHGSFCLSYSGQCYLCSFLEGCSGNRGLCQQNCRRVYSKKGKQGYFLNLKDNSAAPYADKLIASGVDSLKIEGRIKSPAYVYSVVKGWNMLLDDSATSTKPKALFEGVFNRNFTDGYFSDKITSNMLAPSPADTSIKEFGKVVSYTADTAYLTVTNEIPFPLPIEIIIKTGNSFICCANVLEELKEIDENPFLKPNQTETWCTYRIKITGKLEGKITKGDTVSAPRPALNAGEAEEAINSVVFRKIPTTARVTAVCGNLLELELTALNKKEICKSDNALEKPVKIATKKEDFLKQLNRFGSTPFELKETSFTKWEDEIFIPATAVNTLRRKCTAQLLETIDSSRKEKVLSALKCSIKSSEKIKPKLSVFTDDPLIAAELYNSFGESIEILFEMTDPDQSPPITLSIPVFPTIMTQEAENTYAELIKSRNFPFKSEKIILESSGLASAALTAGKKLIAGKSFNITNSLWAKMLYEKCNFIGVIPSLELSEKQIKSFAENSPIPLSVFIYAPLKLMTTRQCLLGFKCGKNRSDKECYYSCTGKSSIDERQGRKLQIVKRKWNYSELYMNSFFSAPEAIPLLKSTGNIQNFIIDVRNFSFANHQKNNIKELTEAFKNFIETEKQEYKNTIVSLTKETNSGNIKKGLK